MTGYTQHDAERHNVERHDGRRAGAFEADRDALRGAALLWRLRHVTQVSGPGEPGRTRLTHSFSVARIARRIAAGLGSDPAMLAIAEAAALAHDLGHPPFGHNGERALNAAAQACGGFEANAQTLRLLLRTPPPAISENTRNTANTVAGVGLTRAVLDATCKYPWPRRTGRRKFGVYADDLTGFTWMRNSTPGGADPGVRLCIEAQIMDWADDLANAVDDLADAITVAAIPACALTGPDDLADITALACEHFTDPALVSADLVADATARLAGHPLADALRAGRHDPRTAARQARAAANALAAGLADATAAATQAAYPGVSLLTRYHAELVVPPGHRALVAVLKALTLRHVLRSPERRGRRDRQVGLLSELVTALLDHAPSRLPISAAQAWRQARTDAERVRVVIDHVASLTDAEAVTLHRGVTACRQA